MPTDVEELQRFKELRVIEHMQMLCEYTKQIPVLQIPTQTLMGVTDAMAAEYNAKYFSKPEEKTEE